PNSAGSQFFIVVADSPHLDKQYSVFGEVIKGMEVADTIVKQPKDTNDNPNDKIEMSISLTKTP
ncbi:MAG TPA: peptidylprolyl isomerase, partial [Nitrososphaerales archaeon]